MKYQIIANIYFLILAVQKRECPWCDAPVLISFHVAKISNAEIFSSFNLRVPLLFYACWTWTKPMAKRCGIWQPMTISFPDVESAENAIDRSDC